MYVYPRNNCFSCLNRYYILLISSLSGVHTLKQSWLPVRKFNDHALISCRKCKIISDLSPSLFMSINVDHVIKQLFLFCPQQCITCNVPLSSYFFVHILSSPCTISMDSSCLWFSVLFFVV